MEVGVPPTMAAVAPNKDKDNTPLDEQLARELHAQLNDPQNAPPLTRRRTRKAPSFYTPQGGGQPAADTSGAESGDLASPQRPAKRAREEASPPALKPILVRHCHASGQHQGDEPAHNISGSNMMQPAHHAAGSGVAVVTKQQEAAEAAEPRQSALSPSAKRSRAQPAGMDASPFEKGSLDHKRSNSGADALDSPRSSGFKSRGSAKLPKLPMVLKGSKWYRGRLLRDSGPRVLIEVSSMDDPSPSQEWLSKDSERLWRGSYKGKDWRYLGDGAWEPRTRSCRRSSLKASGSSNSTDDQVRLGTSTGLDEAGQPCLRCKTSSGNTAEHSQDSKGSSSDRSSLAEDLFESQGNGTPASHPRGKRSGPFDEDLQPEVEDEKRKARQSNAGPEVCPNGEAKAGHDLPVKPEDFASQPSREQGIKPDPAAPSQSSGGNNPESREQGDRNPAEDELQKELGDPGHGVANGLQCEEALPEDDILAGKSSDSPEESTREGQSQAAGCSAPDADRAASHRAGNGDGGSSGEAKPRVEPRRRNIRKKGMKRPRVPLPEEAEEEGSGEEGDKGGAAPEQQAVRASSRIRTPAMKAEGSDFILTHELGRKAPRLTDSGDGGSGGTGRKGGARKGGRRAHRKGAAAAGQTGSLDHFSDGQEDVHQPADSVLAPHGVGRKARRGGLAKGGHFPSGLVHKQRGAMLQRQGSGVSAALVCGNSLGTLIQALHAHENKMAPVHQPREVAALHNSAQHSNGIPPRLFTGTGGAPGQHGVGGSSRSLGPLMVPQILAVAPEAFASYGQQALSQPTAAWMSSFAAPKSPPFPLFV